jgi:hypothetical protein
LYPGDRAFMKKRFIEGFCLLCIFTLSCSGLRQVRPLEKGESRVSLSAGGPFTKVGNIYIPAPLISLGYNYGIAKKLDAEVGTNFFAMLYGIAHFDAGVNWRPLTPRHYVPGLILSPKIFLMTDFRPGDSRIYPDLGFTAYWEIKHYRFVYLGLENFFELSTRREDGNKQQNNWLIAPYAGMTLGNKIWQFQFEAKLYTPNLPNNLHTAKNIGVGDHGIFGVFLGVSRSFGGAR